MLSTVNTKNVKYSMKSTHFICSYFSLQQTKNQPLQFKKKLKPRIRAVKESLEKLRGNIDRSANEALGCRKLNTNSKATKHKYTLNMK